MGRAPDQLIMERDERGNVVGIRPRSVYLYWDHETRQIPRMADALREIEGSSEAVARSVGRMVAALDDRMLCLAAFIMVEDIYKSALAEGYVSEEVNSYLQASAPALLEQLDLRGLILNYVVDNSFPVPPEMRQRVSEQPYNEFAATVLVGEWFRSAGLVFISRHNAGGGLMENDGVDLTRFTDAWPRYSAEAALLARQLLALARQDRRHYMAFEIEGDSDFVSEAMSGAGRENVLAVLRTAPPVPGSKAELFMPARVSGG